jgi:hypothetical protein
MGSGLGDGFWLDLRLVTISADTRAVDELAAWWIGRGIRRRRGGAAGG